MQALERLGWRRMGTTAVEGGGGAATGVARVSGQARGQYRVTIGRGDVLEERSAEVTGRMRHAAMGDSAALPVVGDWVCCRAMEEVQLLITEIVPRRTMLARRAVGAGGGVQPLAANVDVVLIVETLEHAPNLRRIERVLAAAWGSGATPAVLLSKADRHEHPAAARTAVELIAPGVAVHTVSAATGVGLDDVRALLPPGHTGVLVGPSGAGKSTLTNALLGADVQSVCAVRSHDGKGRHTTTARELFALPGLGLLIDTPGLREFGVSEGEVGVDAVYRDVEALATKCRFRDCRHEDEPGCWVLGAVANGILDEQRLAGFRKLARESAYHERRSDPHLSRQHERSVARLHAAVQREWRRRKR